jgi:hypothetical protein
VIRQALGELDIWEVEAKFVLTEHKDSQGLSVMLIKDFKDILNKVQTERRIKIVLVIIYPLYFCKTDRAT